LNAEIDYVPKASDIPVYPVIEDKKEEMNAIPEKTPSKERVTKKTSPKETVQKQAAPKEKKSPKKKRAPLDPLNIPEMVLIKGVGTQKDFFIGKTEVTVRHYMGCVNAGVCRKPKWIETDNPSHIKTGSNAYFKKLGHTLTAKQYPIVGISWNDTLDYAQWLTQHTGDSYRLPTDAQWLYANTAENTNYVWGNDIGSKKANCKKDACGDSYQYAAPVASFPAYKKLHDMHGNVWEWVCSNQKASACLVKNHTTESRVRGGSWNDSAKLLRSTYKETKHPKVYRLNDVGFRLVRLIEKKE
jgi:formylglycine-generating enzyme required for sulfatase activity